MKSKIGFSFVLIGVLSFLANLNGQQTPRQDPGTTKFTIAVASSIAPSPKVMPLYDGPIPNSKAGVDGEGAAVPGVLQKVSKPTIEVFLPAKAKANGSAIIIFPGGAMLSSGC